MLLRLSIAVDDEEEWEDKDEDESDEGGVRTYDVNAKDTHGNSPLLLTCRLGNLEIPEIRVCVGSGVSAANERDDTPLLASVGVGKLEIAEMLVSKGANMEAARMDGTGLVSLDIVSHQTELLNLSLTSSPEKRHVCIRTDEGILGPG
jgi:ankyrin repeat protein